MSQDLWTAVDGYLTGALVTPDRVLDAAVKSSAEAGLPSIAVTPTLGKFLNLIARSLNAKNILEIGTLGGYSTIWLARSSAQWTPDYPRVRPQARRGSPQKFPRRRSRKPH